MRWKKVRRTVVAYTVLGLSYCLTAVPLQGIYVFGGALGFLAYRVARRERRRTVLHLTEFYKDRRSPREIRRIARGVFRHFGYAVAELLALRNPRRFFKRLSISVEGMEYAQAALKRGRGVLFVTGHFGNWELMAAYFAHQGYPIHVVASKIRQPVLQQIIDRYRRTVGLNVYYTKGAGVMPMMRALRRGEVLALLVDIRTEGDGRWVEFLGRPAYTLVGPATLAARTGASVLLGYAVRTRPWAYRFVIQPPVEVEATGSQSRPEREAYVMALLHSLNARLSSVIEQFPEQWMWMHRRHDPVRPGRKKHR